MGAMQEGRRPWDGEQRDGRRVRISEESECPP